MPIHDWSRVDEGIFHAFHHSWLCELTNVLNDGLLPPDYYALIELRRSGPAIPPLSEAGSPVPAGDESIRTELPTNPATRFRHDAGDASYWSKKNRVVVRHEDGHPAVAVIEIVSPCDKAAGFPFRRFVDQSLDLITGKVHLLVIDLTAPTRWTPRGVHAAIWEEFAGESFESPRDEPLTLTSYQAGDSVSAYVEPTRVGAELPEMPLFLVSDGYVSIPLGPTYQAAYRHIPVRWRQVIEGTES
jgi:hypothetical protein